MKNRGVKGIDIVRGCFLQIFRAIFMHINTKRESNKLKIVIINTACEPNNAPMPDIVSISPKARLPFKNSLYKSDNAAIKQKPTINPCIENTNKFLNKNILAKTPIKMSTLMNETGMLIVNKSLIAIGKNINTNIIYPIKT